MHFVDRKRTKHKTIFGTNHSFQYITGATLVQQMRATVGSLYIAGATLIQQMRAIVDSEKTT